MICPGCNLEATELHRCAYPDQRLRAQRAKAAETTERQRLARSDAIAAARASIRKVTAVNEEDQ